MKLIQINSRYKYIESQQTVRTVAIDVLWLTTVYRNSI